MARQVTIAAGQSNVQLPDGTGYNAGDVVILTDAQFEQIADHLIPSIVIDNGPTGITGDEVVDQAAVVAAPAALTSVDAAAPPTAAEFNALRADVVAVRDTLAATLVALKGPGKPMSS